ncbi:hypothetical protein COHA_008558 [Chlorella ohadii]|uniref:Uncharacterized protein n=1 Tax=Chlorella ohadii TaxID=2649997 RepID=A0AAD5GYW4_9CHLO|nr:hypothetical protein COHA_008558 [Chlorella ohadii]
MSEEERARAGGTGGIEAKYEQQLLNKLFDLSGKTAYVTGAAQGMGSWIAAGMARCGADVALADIGNEEKLEGVAQRVRELGRQALTLRVDVRDRPGVEQSMKEAAEQLGGINILVANAGGYNCCRAVYPHLKSAGGGKVAYCASKGALLPLSKSLAVAWGKDNIQVNCLLPGAINTPFLDTVVNTKDKLDYLMDRIPAGKLAYSRFTGSLWLKRSC